MSGVSPVGLAENGTRSGKGSFDLLFMCWVFPNLPSCLPWLATGLVPAGHHYYEGSESSTRASKVCTLLRSPCLSRLNFRTFRLQQHYCHFARLSLTRYLVRLPCEPHHRPPAWKLADLGSSSGRCVMSGVRELLGRSPTGLAESSSLSLRTVHSPLVALHPFC